MSIATGRGFRINPGDGRVLVRSSFECPSAQSIVFSVANQPLGVARTSIPFFRVRWGVEAASHVVDLDAKAGSVVSLIASELTAEVFYPAGTGPAIDVAATIAAGIVQHEAPTLTMFSASVAGGGVGTARLAVPAFATSLLSYRSDADTQNTAINFFIGNNGEGAHKINAAGPGGNAVWPILLQANDQFVNLVNSGAVASTLSLVAVLGL